MRENRLFFSSAEYYDDPFDTFVHVDITRVRALRDYLLMLVNSDAQGLLDFLKVLESFTGISAEQFLKILKENPLDLSRFPDQIQQVRLLIQKNLFSICFCENAFNETLWIKYADNYKGYALVYNMRGEVRFSKGEEVFNNCHSIIEKTFIYPVYYTEEAYDATRFALFWLLQRCQVPQLFLDLGYKMIIWEAERISLIKKKCHEYDQEWRMIRPSMKPERTSIIAKPDKIIVGLRMPENEKMMVISAARAAGINDIEELYINDEDQLASKKIVSQ